MGYSRAGFEVVGVDIAPQPNYPFEFHKADALDFPLDGFDIIHASPPCQGYTMLHTRTKSEKVVYLIPAVRKRLQGHTSVIENVVGAPLRNPVLLCGSMFDLGVGEAWLRRHREFEVSFPIMQPDCRHPKPRRQTIGVYGGGGGVDWRRVEGNESTEFTTQDRKTAMGIDWMKHTELNQAIPPAYTEFIGKQAIEHLRAALV